MISSLCVSKLGIDINKQPIVVVDLTKSFLDSPQKIADDLTVIFEGTDWMGRRFHVILGGNNGTLEFNERVESTLFNIIKKLSKTVRYCDIVLHKTNEEYTERQTVGGVYSAEEMERIVGFQNKLDKKIGPGTKIKFSEDKPSKYGVSNYWNIEQTLYANQQLDKVVEDIKRMELSPFEAALYIHNYCASFYYNNSDEADSALPRELPNILAYGKIVCVGYAQMFKAIVDKLGMKGLSASLNLCNVPSKKSNEFAGHMNNNVTINDPKYNINGQYAEDACWDSENFGAPHTFAFCLQPLASREHFRERWYYPTNYNDIEGPVPKNTNRYNDQAHLKNNPETEALTGLEMIAMRKTYFKQAVGKGKVIDSNKFVEGLTTIYKKMYGNEFLDEQIAAMVKDVIFATIHAQYMHYNNADETTTFGAEWINSRLLMEYAEEYQGKSPFEYKEGIDEREILNRETDHVGHAAMPISFHKQRQSENASPEEVEKLKKKAAIVKNNIAALTEELAAAHTKDAQDADALENFKKKLESYSEKVSDILVELNLPNYDSADHKPVVSAEAAQEMADQLNEIEANVGTTTEQPTAPKTAQQTAKKTKGQGKTNNNPNQK